MTLSRFIAMILTAVILIYPLSIGPAMRMRGVHRGVPAPTSGAFRTFYKPLEVLCRNQSVNAVFGWYIDQWLPP
jgi:hypothetical protein